MGHVAGGTGAATGVLGPGAGGQPTVHWHSQKRPWRVDQDKTMAHTAETKTERPRADHAPHQSPAKPRRQPPPHPSSRPFTGILGPFGARPSQHQGADSSCFTRRHGTGQGLVLLYVFSTGERTRVRVRDEAG